MSHSTPAASPFLEQIQKLEAKLRLAQDTAASSHGGGGATSYGGGLTEPSVPRSAMRPSAGSVHRTPSASIAAEAIEEAADVRMRMARELISNSERQQRENETLSSRLSHMDQSLRASEAARRLEAARQAEEVHAVRLQLEDERRRSFGSPDMPTRALGSGGDGGAGAGAGAGASAGSGAGTGGGAMSFTREWQLRAELAEATHEAQLARAAAQASAAEQQRVSSELSSRAASATQGVLRLQDEVRSSLEERHGLVAQLHDTKAVLDGMRTEHMNALREKTAAAEAVAAASHAADAARHEAAEARRQAQLALRAEEEARELGERRRADAVTEATRAAAEAVATAQATTSATLERERQTSKRREAELSSQARHLAASLDAANEGLHSWEARALTAEQELSETRRSLAMYKAAATPCTADQMRAILEHTFGVELRDEERRFKAQTLAITELREEVGRLRTQLRHAEASAENAAKAARAGTDAQAAEHAAAAKRLSDALGAAEQLCVSERSSSQQRLDEVRESANQLLGAERARRESAEAELHRLRKEGKEQREEIDRSHVAMRDAQRAALEAATTARRVAVAASQEYDQRMQRESEVEGQYGKWVALEAQLRESHADALVAAENEKRLRMSAEGELRRMEESGVLAARQAEEERSAKAAALALCQELRRETARHEAMVCSLALALGEADDATDQLHEQRGSEVAGLRDEVFRLQAEAAEAAERHENQLLEAKDDATRFAAKAAASAAEEAEARLRRDMLSHFAAEQAVSKAQTEHELATARGEGLARLQALLALQGCEFEAMERRLVETGVEGAVALAQLTALEESLNEGAESPDLEAELAETRASSENLIQRLTRERDEARAEAVANASAAREAAEAAKEEVGEMLREQMEMVREEAAAAKAALEENNAQAELERDSHAGQLAISAHAVDRLVQEKAALEEKLAMAEEMRLREVAALEGRATDAAERLAQLEEERRSALDSAEEEKERIAAELEAERQRRETMQGIHEKETASLKGALHKATGYKDAPKPPAAPSRRTISASDRATSGSEMGSGAASPTAIGRGVSPPPTAAAGFSTSKTGATKPKATRP